MIMMFFSFNSYAQNCIHCMYYQNYMGFNPYQNTGFGQVYNYYTPWWNQYSMPRYSYYNTPAPWMNYGMNGSQYPSHHGGGMMGKPNVYVYGKNGDNFKITFEFSEKSLLLSAIPSYQTEWKGTVTNGGIIYDNVFYRYFYYDYGVDISKLQWEEGECVKDANLMEYLNNLLTSSGFNKREIDDFNEYWSYKMPPGEEFCVYPQGNKELDRVAKLDIEPKATINRLSFFIVPQVDKGMQKIPFFKKPTRKWTPKHLKQKNSIYVNEWGVGWIDESNYL